MVWAGTTINYFHYNYRLSPNSRGAFVWYFTTTEENQENVRVTILVQKIVHFTDIYVTWIALPYIKWYFIRKQNSAVYIWSYKRRSYASLSSCVFNLSTSCTNNIIHWGVLYPDMYFTIGNSQCSVLIVVPCFKCVFLSLWCRGWKVSGNCIDSWSLPSFLYSFSVSNDP